MFGSWLDDGLALAGWDVERFQEIADSSGKLWLDSPVEYPPGSVVAIEALSTEGNIVATHRVLVVVSLLVDLFLAWLLYRKVSFKVSLAYLALGVALLPMGLVRFDLWAALFAVAATLFLVSKTSARPIHIFLFALTLAFGALVKVWPALILIAAFGLKKWRHTAVAVLLLGVLGLGWLFWVGNGLDPVSQVVSLRGATGWHVESLVGNFVAVFADGSARLELNAYRIGSLNDSLALFMRAVAIGVFGLLGLIVFVGKKTNLLLYRASLLTMSAVAVLLVTAPLLSPQFLLWLTPWVAIVLFDTSAKEAGVNISYAACFAAAAVVLTGLTLGLFAPPTLDQTVPSLMLLVRNFLLLGVVVLGVFELWVIDRNRSFWIASRFRKRAPTEVT